MINTAILGHDKYNEDQYLPNNFKTQRGAFKKSKTPIKLDDEPNPLNSLEGRFLDGFDFNFQLSNLDNQHN